MRMKWDKLLSADRLGYDGKGSSDPRKAFVRDWDRLVYSSAFRRMQDKTQVFPLAASDYVRTRLTHSIEVASVGRSLGNLVGAYVVDELHESTNSPEDFGNVVAAACIAHDIGNPPFGHSGEDAIRHWFTTKAGAACLDGLSVEEADDFKNFEGNAQGFRIITRLQDAIDAGGLQLTYATLGTFTKYPRKAWMPELAASKNVSEKKYGFFASDQDTFEQIAEQLTLVEKSRESWCRHPLAFLMEAADDICYRIVDLEDGQRLGRVPFKEAEELLKGILGDEDQIDEPYYETLYDERGKTEYLRAKAIGRLIGAVVKAFKANYTAIIQGKFERDLISVTGLDSPLKAISETTKSKIYAAQTVVQIEAAGYEVLGGLLEKFATAMVKEVNERTAEEKKIIQLVPRQFKDRKSRYERLLGATDFVSGMTDTFALSTYRRLKGIEMPRGG
jgi:dGTPase